MSINQTITTVKNNANDDNNIIINVLNNVINDVIDINMYNRNIRWFESLSCSHIVTGIRNDRNVYMLIYNVEYYSILAEIAGIQLKWYYTLNSFLHSFHNIAKCDIELYKLLYNYPIYYNNRFENKMYEILNKRRKMRKNSRNKHTLIITKMLSKSKNVSLNKLPSDVFDTIVQYLNVEECVYCNKHNIDIGLSHGIDDCEFYKRCQCSSCQRGNCNCMNCKNDIRLSPYFTDCDMNQHSLIPFKLAPINPQLLVNLHDISYNDETGERGLYHIPIHYHVNDLNYISSICDKSFFHEYNNYAVKDIREGDDYKTQQKIQWIEWYDLNHYCVHERERKISFIKSRIVSSRFKIC